MCWSLIPFVTCVSGLQATSSPETFQHTDVHSPHVVVYGNPFRRSSKVFIHVDGVPMLATKNCLEAFVIVYATYYALWLQFPKTAQCSYKFLGVKVFQHDQLQEKLPAKLIRLVSKLRNFD